jgi:aryl-alcohol dehydrogenase-like predicted oxidoreductase
MKRLITGFHRAESVAKMKYRSLGETGMETSILSLGGSAFSKIYGKYDVDECISVVQTALKSGINYLDTAPWYGQGESERFLCKALKGVPRGAYYIATKVGRYDPELRKMFDFRPERLKVSVSESLDRLGVDYVDILQVHDVEFAPDILLSPNTDYVFDVVLPVMEELKNAGLCRFIGITSYSIAVLKEIVEKSKVKVDSVLSYSRLTMNDSSLAEYFDFFQSQGVPIINASPVAMGLLTNPGPQPWHPAPDDIKETCFKAAKYCQEQGVDIARLAFHYSLQFSQVSTTLTSVTDQDMLGKNLDLVYSGLTSHEKEVQEYVIRTYFDPLPIKSWDDREREEYKRILQNTDSS